MSADNGWILRKNPRGEFVVQEYWASADNYPPISDAKEKFDNLEDAVNWYENNSGYSEYGLTVHIQEKEQAPKKSIKFTGLVPAMDGTHHLIPVEFEITDSDLITKLQRGIINDFSLHNVKEKE